MQPDVVIMDINIPIINGLKVIQVKPGEASGHVAFVIVSGYDDVSYLQGGSAAADARTIF